MSHGECKITDQIKGVEYAIQHANEIDVLNISIENPNSPALNSIINAAVKAGITVVVAAGNSGKDASATISRKQSQRAYCLCYCRY